MALRGVFQPCPSVAEAHDTSGIFTVRINPCPFKTHFHVAVEVTIRLHVNSRDESVPFQTFRKRLLLSGGEAESDEVGSGDDHENSHPQQSNGTAHDASPFPESEADNAAEEHVATHVEHPVDVAETVGDGLAPSVEEKLEVPATMLPWLPLQHSSR